MNLTKQNKFYFSSIFIVILLGLLRITPIQAQENINAERKQAIDSLALEKVKDLQRYISVIGNKSTSFSHAKRVIDRATELFVENAEMAVSTLASEGVKNYQIKKYFQRLMALNYDKIEIKWFNIEYISDLKIQPDGRYVGIITIYQRFEGRTKEGLIYKDTTKKDITIFVERKETQIGGKMIGFWDVLLGDIRVVETNL